MTGLIGDRFGYWVARIISIALSMLAGLVFLVASLPGFYTWKQAFYDLHGINIETIMAAVAAILFLPGIAPLLAAFYFFIYLSKPLYNLIGLLAMIPVVFVHFLVSVPASHSNGIVAFGLGAAELLLVLGLLWLFNRFVVHRDHELNPEH